MNTPPPDMPSGLTIFAIGFTIMLTFVLFLWAVNTLPGKVREIMSRPGGGGGDSVSGAAPVQHPAPAPALVSAEPNTAGAERVPGAASAAALDPSARDIIKAATIAELLDAGIITNRDKAICQAFKCSKAASTRPDSPFQQALRLVEQHRRPSGPEFRPLDEQRRPAELSSAGS